MTLHLKIDELSCCV